MSGGIIAYLHNTTVFSVITPIFTFLIPVVIQTVVLSSQLIPFVGRMFGIDAKVKIEGDLFEIKWKTKTAELL